jgi:hypothetical protein
VQRRDRFTVVPVQCRQVRADQLRRRPLKHPRQPLVRIHNATATIDERGAAVERIEQHDELGGGRGGGSHRFTRIQMRTIFRMIVVNRPRVVGQYLRRILLH